MAGVWEAFTTNKEWEVYLKNLVKTNDYALCKAIVLIYENQTTEEKLKDESVEENQIGFTKWDAKEMSEIARKIKAKEPLSKGEVAKSRNKMQKYWKQLMIISKQQMKEKEEAERELQHQISKRYFSESIAALNKCSEEGIACDFGICDECPVTQGLQMRMIF